MEKRMALLLRGLPLAVLPPILAVPAIRFLALSYPEAAPYVNRGISVLVLVSASIALWHLGRTFVGKFDSITVLAVLASAFAGLIIYLTSYILVFGNLFRMASG